VNAYATGQLVTATNANAGTGRCDIVRLAIGGSPTGNQVGCTAIAQNYSFNPLMDAKTSPFQNGNRAQAGLSVSGGGDASTYYVSGGYERENGVLPQNQIKRIRVQANSGQFGSKLR
jgi:hypothetical protein